MAIATDLLVQFILSTIVIAAVIAGYNYLAAQYPTNKVISYLQKHNILRNVVLGLVAALFMVALTAIMLKDLRSAMGGVQVFIETAITFAVVMYIIEPHLTLTSEIRKLDSKLSSNMVMMLNTLAVSAVGGLLYVALAGLVAMGVSQGVKTSKKLVK